MGNRHCCNVALGGKIQQQPMQIPGPPPVQVASGLIEQLQQRGFKSPYLRTYVVARLNPVRWLRPKAGEPPPMTVSAALTRMRGAARTGRSLDDVEICLKPLIGTAPDSTKLERVAETVRARVAFYLSTPSYRSAFEVYGWGDIAREASQLSRAQRWDDLPGLVNDEMLHTVATIGTYDQIADKLNDRFAERLDRIEFSIPVTNADDADAYRQILGQLKSPLPTSPS